MLIASTVVLAAISTSVPASSDGPTLTYVGARRDCSEIVDRVLEKTKGRLLSIRPHDDQCTVTVLVPREGERPEKAVFRVEYKDLDADKKD